MEVTFKVGMLKVKIEHSKIKKKGNSKKIIKLTSRNAKKFKNVPMLLEEDYLFLIWEFWWLV